MTMQRIPVVERILAANDDVAAHNRRLLDAHRRPCHQHHGIAGRGQDQRSF